MSRQHNMLHINNVPGVSAPQGPYSQAIIAVRANTAYLSGRISPSPEANEPDTIGRQTIRIMGEMHVLLGHMGLSLEDVVHTGVFVDAPDRLAAFREFNESYAGYFGKYAADAGLEQLLYPTRSTILPGLLLGAGVELDMQASLPDHWSVLEVGASQTTPYTYEQVIDFARQ